MLQNMLMDCEQFFQLCLWSVSDVAKCVDGVTSV